MSSAPDLNSKPSNNMRFVLPVLLAVVVVAAIGYFAATRGGIDKQMVQQSLDSWGGHLTAYGTSQGQTVRFTYDDVEMKGEAAGRYAVVKNPTVVIERTDEESGAVEVTKLGSIAVELHPESVTMDAFKVVMAEPLSVQVNGEDTGSIISAEPAVLHLKQRTEKNRQWVTALLAVPPHITLKEPNEAESLVIKSDAGASLSATVDPKARWFKQSDAALSNLVIEDLAGTKFLSLKKLSLVTRSEEREGGDYEATLKAEISDLMTDDASMPYGALSAGADIAYEGPLLKDGESPDWASTPAKLEVKRLDIEGKDAGATLTAGFTTGGGELLPVGSAQLNIRNFAFIRDELARHGTLDKESEKVLAILIGKITGKPAAEAKDLEVELKREMGGSLKIGQMSLEEALAIVLTGGKLAPPPPAATPAAPAKGEKL